jgi:hypothetical protein
MYDFLAAFVMMYGMGTAPQPSLVHPAEYSECGPHCQERRRDEEREREREEDRHRRYDEHQHY